MNIKELIEKYENKYSGINMSFATAVLLTEIQKDLKRLDESQKVTVPQFVADYIKDAKYYEWDLDDVFDHIAEESEEEIYKWFYVLGNVDIFARAWLDGYTVEKEKRYTVKMKGIEENINFLNYGYSENEWYLADEVSNSIIRTHHNRKELEEAGFGWVFDCEGIEVKEVKE